MNHHALTLLVLQLNSLLDSGKYDGITLDEVKRRIDDGTILQFLQTQAAGDASFNDWLEGSAYEGFEKFYLTQLQALLDGYGGSERRKWGVQNRGLCLLIAWTNEILQQGTGWKPAAVAPRGKA